MPVPVEFDRVVHIGVPLAVHHLAGADFTGAPGTVNEDLDVRSVCPGDVFVLDDAHVRHVGGGADGMRWSIARTPPRSGRSCQSAGADRPPGSSTGGTLAETPWRPGSGGQLPEHLRPLDHWIGTS